MTGRIPPELGNLDNLRSLDLQNNALTGSIPPAFGNLANLQLLWLASNRLTGTIPPELGDLPGLRGLLLEYNSDLSGPFPLRLLQSSSLFTVDLHATRVCVPRADDAFEEWVAGGRRFHHSGLTCGRPAPAVPEIDVAVFYTPAARRETGGTAAMEAEIDLLIAETNQAYSDSGVKQRVVLAAREELQYTETDSSHTDLNNFGSMAEVRALRDRVGADLVHLVKVRKNYPTPYSHGYVNQRAFAPGAPFRAGWATIMAYWNQCADADLSSISCWSLLRFSNPNQTWDGDPLGVPGDTPSLRVDGPADAVRMLNETRHSIAAFRKGTLDRYYDIWEVLGNGEASDGAARAVAPVAGGGAASSGQPVAAFADPSVRPGTTPVRAIHFRELRARIGAVRARAGLPAFQWTDPTLTAGETPVRRVHLTELRAALDEVYDAEGRSRPRYTDATVTAGATPIRAAHLTELRTAVAAVDAGAGSGREAAGTPGPAPFERGNREDLHAGQISEVEERRSGLFAAAAAQDEARAAARRDGGALRDAVTLRRRLVTVDYDVLARAVAGVTLRARPATLTLNLFDDVVFTGTVERVASTLSDGWSLSGRLEGVPFGTITLVMNDSVVAGAVRIPLATYRIGPAGESLHAVSRIDPSKLPRGAEPVSAERPDP